MLRAILTILVEQNGVMGEIGKGDGKEQKGKAWEVNIRGEEGDAGVGGRMREAGGGNK